MHCFIKQRVLIFMNKNMIPNKNIQFIKVYRLVLSVIDMISFNEKTTNKYDIRYYDNYQFVI